MNTAYRQPDPNYYRLTRGTHVTMGEDGGLAICDYPLRAVRLNTTDEGRLIYLPLCFFTRKSVRKSESV